MTDVRVRPTFELVSAVINLLLDEGKPLKDAVQAQGLTMGQFNWYLQQDREAAAAVARAQEFRADLLVDEALHLADGTGDPAKVRNQISIRQWTAERYNRKKFGERIDLNVTQTLDIGSTLNEARARLLRPVRDQLTHDDAQVLDVPMRIATPAGDMASQTQEPGASARPLDEPDIFS